MKNVLIVVLFLFVASFSFVGCDGDDGDTGASGIMGPTGDIGATGDNAIGEDQHFDYVSNAAYVCDAGEHYNDGSCQANHCGAGEYLNGENVCTAGNCEAGFTPEPVTGICIEDGPQ